MKVRVYFKEVSYGSLVVDVPADAKGDVIMEKAWDEFHDGDCDWGKCDCDITDWEKEED